MNIEDKLTMLKQKVLQAFANVPYPKGILAPHECEECLELRETFKDQNWKTIDQKIIEKNYGQLPLFSSEAFHCFLPAYLIYSLENFNDNLICEFTIYALSPSKKDLKESFDYWKERFQYFTDEQMEMIYQFLDLVNENKDSYFISFENISAERLKSVRDQQN